MQRGVGAKHVSCTQSSLSSISLRLISSAPFLSCTPCQSTAGSVGPGRDPAFYAAMCLLGERLGTGLCQELKQANCPRRCLHTKAGLDTAKPLHTAGLFLEPKSVACLKGPSLLSPECLSATCSVELLRWEHGVPQLTWASLRSHWLP